MSGNSQEGEITYIPFNAIAITKEKDLETLINETKFIKYLVTYGWIFRIGDTIWFDIKRNKEVLKLFYGFNDFFTIPLEYKTGTIPGHMRSPGLFLDPHEDHPFGSSLIGVQNQQLKDLNVFSLPNGYALPQHQDEVVNQGARIKEELLS